MLEQTSDLATAHQWAVAILRDGNVAKYFISESNFLSAYKSESSFSFIVRGEPFYGQLYGEEAYLDPRCTEIATLDKNEREGWVNRGEGFQFWEAQTGANGSSIEILSNAEEINSMIADHAPDSSVHPGDPEEIFWGGIRNGLGELVASAGLVKWQSGFHVMVAVVTRTQDRGKGLATRLSAGMLAHANSLGIKEIGLGVRTGNIAAQRAYEKAGFKKLAEFTHYSRE